MLQIQSLQRPDVVNLIAIGNVLVVAKHFSQILLNDRNVLHVHVKILRAFDLCRERNIIIVRMQFQHLLIGKRALISLFQQGIELCI